LGSPIKSRIRLCPKVAGSCSIWLPQIATCESFPYLRKSTPTDPTTLTSFGRGLHACSGQHLARAEMRLTLKTLLTRLPDIHLAGDIEEAGLSGGLMIEAKSLPVALTPEC
jgi:cytochrome P450